ncbi:MAG: radical SAM protein [Clostridia bacterium]|nr:radical SAM protein [Clostridia bacterium]
MNKYLKNLEKIEFVVTYACTGRCKHCSEGDHKSCGVHMDPAVAADAVKKITAAYPIKTVMTFGGEPLLYPETVYAVMKNASELNIPKRQIITNGYFSKDAACIREVARRLAESGVNDLRLSADAFHQEYIPLEPVKIFAEEAKAAGIPIRIQPAWLVSRDDGNEYNIITKQIISEFAELGIKEADGNVIFPEGNALKYFAEYFADSAPDNPYVEDPADVRCISFDPDGTALGGNVYEKDIIELLENYKPM